MNKVLALTAAIMIFLPATSMGAGLLIPMDLTQTDHLKAYGVAYWCLENNVNVQWLLNYRGGSFLTDDIPQIAEVCRLKGVSFQQVSGPDEAEIMAIIEKNNMEMVLLEKAPKVAIYAPPSRKNEPWDDAVNLALEYAEIPFEIVWDPDVLLGKLAQYDWIHLHHEDFTGQYGKFYAAYRSTLWYKQDKALNEMTARELGYKKVSRLKLDVSEAIEDYVADGGFLFAMCSATDTYDIARAAWQTDIAPPEFDGDSFDPNYLSKLDFGRTFAFENFDVILNPSIYEHSNIDTTPIRGGARLTPEADYFSLFDFSAKWDPVPTMLVQNHTDIVNGFWGQCTGYRKDLIKKNVTILAETPGKDEAKYIHGNHGKGTFTFLAGHDPEDYQHRIGDPSHRSSPTQAFPGIPLDSKQHSFPGRTEKREKNLMAERFKMIRGRLGFASVAVDGGFEILADFAVEHGFDLVQIGLDSGRFFPERIDDDERGRIKDLFSRKNVALSFHGPSDIPLMNRHDKIRQAGLERYCEMIDLAVDLGGGQFVIHPGRLAFYSVSSKKIVFMERRIPGFHLELFADSLQKLLKHASRRIEICMENTHALPHQFLAVISHLSREKGLGLVWDAGHTELASPVNRERIIRFFRDNIRSVRLAHLHDMADGVDHKELGTGQINIDGYLEIFNTIEVDIVLEIFPEDKLLKSVEYLKKLLPVKT